MKETIESLRFRITKRFGTKTVLRDFALEVRGKQFITFLGPSGCGKSTALNIVAGLIPATEGEVWIDGEKYFLGSSADRRARDMAESGEIERKRIGKFVYFRLKQEHKQETMFQFTNHALNS